MEEIHSEKVIFYFFIFYPWTEHGVNKIKYTHTISFSLFHQSFFFEVCVKKKERAKPSVCVRARGDGNFGNSGAPRQVFRWFPRAGPSVARWGKFLPNLLTTRCLLRKIPLLAATPLPIRSAAVEMQRRRGCAGRSHRAHRQPRPCLRLAPCPCHPARGDQQRSRFLRRCTRKGLSVLTPPPPTAAVCLADYISVFCFFRNDGQWVE
jgi:hypothetical protein